MKTCLRTRRGVIDRSRCSASRGRGLSLVELLIALAIISALLTATAVAVDVSFKAYAIATQSASTQSSTRLLTNRLLTMIRNSAAHAPLTAGGGAVFDPADDDIIISPFISFTDRNGDVVTLEYDDMANTFLLVRNGGTPQLVMEGVQACEFRLQRGFDEDGLSVLRRATIDFTVEAGDDSTLQIEAGNVPPVRVVASTKPRRF